jgi:hypothetical protein
MVANDCACFVEGYGVKHLASPVPWWTLPAVGVWIWGGASSVCAGGCLPSSRSSQNAGGGLYQAFALHHDEYAAALACGMTGWGQQVWCCSSLLRSGLRAVGASVGLVCNPLQQQQQQQQRQQPALAPAADWNPACAGDQAVQQGMFSAGCGLLCGTCHAASVQMSGCGVHGMACCAC